MLILVYLTWFIRLLYFDTQLTDSLVEDLSFILDDNRLTYE